jgi:signal transduction histidine kinase
LEILFYLRLVALSAGALVYLFLLALILGHRRPRSFERLLFLLLLGLFFTYAGHLLFANTILAASSRGESIASSLLIGGLEAAGFFLVFPLVWQVHYSYRRQFFDPVQVPGKWASYLARPLVVVFYLMAAALLAAGIIVLIQSDAPSASGRIFTMLESWNGSTGILLGGIALCDAAFEVQDFRSARTLTERRLFQALFVPSLVAGVCLVGSQLVTGHRDLPSAVLLTVAAVVGVLPGATLIYFSLKHNFLEYGAQRNLVYGLLATVLALLYLALVHRVSGWLEPYFPPEATAGFLLFILIFLFEPLERVIGPALHRRIHAGMEGLQRLTAELQEQARQGSVVNLLFFAERRVREEFGLAAVRISIPNDPKQELLKSPGGLGHVARIPIKKEGKEIGLLEAATTGAFLTGETSAALEFLAEQLPGLVDLAQTIEEKVHLERELAERERLALLGQMAASVSHNLRNPLSSMKTILQVQLENPDLPFDARHDCGLVVEEIDRMSAKLTQLLKYSKPSVNGHRVAVVALARQLAALLGRDAERRNIRMEFDQPAEELEASASEEALSEILSNLLVNAIEAQPRGGRVRVSLRQQGERAEIEIEDDGPGIAPDAQPKIFQPFFTTKASGTGLGLSIVARRVAELGGTVVCESPVREGRGTKFRVALPAVDSRGEGKVRDAENPDRG